MSAGLPTGWTWATVNDLARYVNGLAFKPSDWQQSGRPIIRIQNLTGKSAFNHTTKAVSDDVVVREGDLLVSWSATLDAFVWRGPEAVLNQHIFKVIPSDHIRDHVFLRWALKNAIEELWASEHSHGTTMKHVNRGPFLAHTLKLPPDREQGRIADALDSCFTRLDDAVATLERVQRNLKRYRASVLKAAIEGRLVPTEAELARAEGRSYEPASVLLQRILAERRRRWEEAELAKMKAKGKIPTDDKWKAKYKEPVAPDTTDLPELPEGWNWASVSQIGEAVTGTTPPTKNLGNYGYDVPFFKPTDLDAGYNVSEARQFLSRRGAECARLLPTNTVLVTCIGATIGKTGLARVPCATNQQINALIPDDSIRATRFLFWYFSSPSGQSEVIGRASSTTLPILNKGRFELLPVPLAPVAEQARIVAEIERLLSVASALTDSARLEQRRLVRLRQSILKWAFEGRLVDQDPSDEPASALLERIRTARESARPKAPLRAARRGASSKK